MSRLLVVKYDGSKLLNTATQLLIANVVRNSGVADSPKIEVFQYDSSELGQLPTERRIDPIEQAIVYIGTLFALYLVGPEQNHTRFAVALWNGLIHESDDSELAKAVALISEHGIDNHLPTALEYGINADILDAIRSINKYKPQDVTRVAVRKNF